MGKVLIKNLSGASVFVQSSNMNEMWGIDGKTVVKIPAGHEAVIFDNQKFAARLAQKVQYGFESAFQLIKMCTIHLSFVKGWGSDYKRTHVTSTPCWVEIHLNGPFQWLDRVLREMGGPKAQIGSVSWAHCLNPAPNNSLAQFQSFNRFPVICFRTVLILHASNA